MSTPLTSDQERAEIVRALAALGNDLERRWKIETTDWGTEIIAMSPQG
ncbi:hypothetical protein [Streptomyces noursei]|nr:hypothetical protein [Streptomyces noursei]